MQQHIEINPQALCNKLAEQRNAAMDQAAMLEVALADAQAALAQHEKARQQQAAELQSRIDELTRDNDRLQALAPTLS